MSKLLQAVLTASLVSSFANFAHAECRRAYVCDDDGRKCLYQDICDSKLDLPSVGLNPLLALPSMDLKPLPSMELPPLGTTRCEYKQVNGQWQNVCR